MNHRFRSILSSLALLLVCAAPLAALAQDPAPQVIEREDPGAETTSPDTNAAASAGEPESERIHVNAVVSIGHDSTLSADKIADAVVSVFGSSTADGEVREAVVSVFGDTRVNAPVGEGAVAVFGDLYINSKISGDAVAVL